ncbi:hypothetical protein MKX03_034720 [Papaver bracteatum]|nr:hypothetical protein MKX03_034720 [Papaver bracteatum]
MEIKPPKIKIKKKKKNQTKKILDQIYQTKKKKLTRMTSTTEAELDFFLKRYFLFQLRWHSSLDQRIINSIQIYCLLLRPNNPKQIVISSIQRGEMRLDLLLIQKDLNLTELINKGVLIIEPVRLSIQGDGLFIMYQTIVISLVHKTPRCRRELRIQICLKSEKRNVLDRKKFFYNKNNIKNCGTFLEESKHLDKDPKNLDRDRNKLMKLKFFFGQIID